MSNFLRPERCPWCKKDTVVSYLDFAHNGYFCKCMECGKFAPESEWKKKKKRKQEGGDE